MKTCFRFSTFESARTYSVPALCIVAAFFAATTELSAETVRSLKPKFTSMMTIAGCTNEQSIALANFPVPVRISTTKIEGFYYDKCDGADDISFSDESGNILPHEVEVWNTEGESVAWVSVPQVYTNAVFYMNWGHDTKLETVQSQEVWTVATYKGVWHMEESDIVHDSSAASRAMTVQTSRTHGVVSNANAKIGTAFFQKSSAASDGPDVAMKTGDIYMGYTSDCTLTGWISLKGYTGTNNNPFGPYKKSNTYYWSIYPGSSWTKTLLRFKTTESTTAVATFAAKSAGWFHYSIAIHKNAAFDLYLNGEYVGSHTPGNAGYYKYSGPLSLYLTGYQYGYLDETRIRDSLSSTDWIKAEYDSVNNKDFLIASKAVKNGGGFIIVVQ